MQDAVSLPARAALLISAVALLALPLGAQPVPIDDSDWVDRSPGGGTIRRLRPEEALAAWLLRRRLRRLLIWGVNLIFLALLLRMDSPESWMLLDTVRWTFPFRDAASAEILGVEAV